MTTPDDPVEPGERTSYLTAAEVRAAQVTPADVQFLADFAGNANLPTFTRETLARIAQTLRGLAEPQPTCEWREEDPWGPTSDTYATSCGELWSFIDGGPTENRVRYCHRCGKPVTVVPYPQPADEDAADGVEGEGNG